MGRLHWTVTIKFVSEEMAAQTNQYYLKGRKNIHSGYTTQTAFKHYFSKSDINDHVCAVYYVNSSLMDDVYLVLI